MVSALYSIGVERIVSRARASITNGTTHIAIDGMTSFSPQFKSEGVQPIPVPDAQGVQTIDIAQRNQFWSWRCQFYNDENWEYPNSTGLKSFWDKFLELIAMWQEVGDKDWLYKIQFYYPDGTKRIMTIQGKIQNINPVTINYGEIEHIDFDIALAYDNLNPQFGDD